MTVLLHKLNITVIIYLPYCTQGKLKRNINPLTQALIILREKNTTTLSKPLIPVVDCVWFLFESGKCGL